MSSHSGFWPSSRTGLVAGALVFCAADAAWLVLAAAPPVLIRTTTATSDPIDAKAVKPLKSFMFSPSDNAESEQRLLKAAACSASCRLRRMRRTRPKAEPTAAKTCRDRKWSLVHRPREAQRRTILRESEYRNLDRHRRFRHRLPSPAADCD